VYDARRSTSKTGSHVLCECAALVDIWYQKFPAPALQVWWARRCPPAVSHQLPDFGFAWMAATRSSLRVRLTRTMATAVPTSRPTAVSADYWLIGRLQRELNPHVSNLRVCWSPSRRS
jgi:hypothetical protein